MNEIQSTDTTKRIREEMTSLIKKKVFLKIQIWFQNFTLQKAFVLHRNFITLKKQRLE